MGFFNFVKGVVGKEVSDMAWTYYENARDLSTDELIQRIEFENRSPLKSVYLLILGNRSYYDAEEIFMNNKNLYLAQFDVLRHNRRFDMMIDDFLRLLKRNSAL